MILNLNTHSSVTVKHFLINADFRFIRIAFTFLLTVIFYSSQAQFNQGRILLGGDITLSSMTDKTTQTGFSNTSVKTTQFRLTPKVGYFVIDNLAIGADISFSTTSSSSTSSTFIAGPFVRYYIKNLFIEGAYGFGAGKDGDTKSSINGWLAGIGYAVFLNDYVAIEPMVTYTSNSVDYKDLNDKSTVAGLAVGVGFQIYLGDRN